MLALVLLIAAVTSVGWYVTHRHLRQYEKHGRPRHLVVNRIYGKRCPHCSSRAREARWNDFVEVAGADAIFSDGSPSWELLDLPQSEHARLYAEFEGFSDTRKAWCDRCRVIVEPREMTQAEIDEHRATQGRH